MLRGALAAAVTPLRDGGEALDEDAFAPYVDFLAAGGLDGVLAVSRRRPGYLRRAGVAPRARARRRRRRRGVGARVGFPGADRGGGPERRRRDGSRRGAHGARALPVPVGAEDGAGAAGSADR